VRKICPDKDPTHELHGGHDVRKGELEVVDLLLDRLDVQIVDVCGLPARCTLLLLLGLLLQATRLVDNLLNVSGIFRVLLYLLLLFKFLEARLLPIANQLDRVRFVQVRLG